MMDGCWLYSIIVTAGSGFAVRAVLPTNFFLDHYYYITNLIK